MANHNPAESLLHRLDLVKETKAGQWQALCPAHDDKTPSLAIKQTDDGTVLLKCWAGCGAADIVHAVGLELKDLFQVQTAHRHKRTPYYQRQNVNHRELLQRIHVDLTVVVIAAGDILRGELNESDRPRIIEAYTRLQNILEAANV